jgi:hypothetical protein
MPRNRTIYPNEALFVGPAPASGYSFMNYLGELGNNGDYNLIFPLHRVQYVDYGVNANYSELQVLGKNAVLNRPQIQPPEASLGFEYLQNGVLNELRMGFYANYEVQYGMRSGEAYYPDNFNVFLLSGFIADQELGEGEPNELRWPLRYRDRRNLYLATEREGYDLHHPTLHRQIHPNAANLSVAGFGNCYITNYSARAAVGDFPRVAVSYVGENMKFYSSGSGLANPAVDSKSGNLVQDRIFNIPNFQSGSYGVSVLLPGQITVDLSSSLCLTGINAVDGTGFSRGDYSQDSLFENLGIKYTDIKIQNYQIDIPLPRRSLRGIGYKYPLNRVVDFPLSYNLNFSCIVGDSHTGDFTQFMRQNDDYNVTIKMQNPPTAPTTGIGIRYDMLRAKLQDIRYRDRIGDKWKTADLRFKGDIDPDDLSRGIFISGKPNFPNLLETDFLLQEDDFYVLQEDGTSRIIIRQIDPPTY